MFAKGGGRTTRRGPAIARKRKGKRQGSAASSDGTPAAEKRRKQPPKASAEQGVRRSKRKASSLGGGPFRGRSGPRGRRARRRVAAWITRRVRRLAICAICRSWAPPNKAGGSGALALPPATSRACTAARRRRLRRAQECGTAREAPLRWCLARYIRVPKGSTASIAAQTSRAARRRRMPRWSVWARPSPPPRRSSPG